MHEILTSYLGPTWRKLPILKFAPDLRTSYLADQKKAADGA